ncbi:hypothetical protein F8M41_025073 [Gigaspora margarita]|uniref:Uncharacterized protein n=1 Tax=Gigaspora margarita TaxID=4874 RepID=A0A8H4B052_GIGMA|nr:hypothetical protein F8M41_025073 [Gigaspora margarita]
MERYKSEQASIGQKRPYEEEVPSTPPDKIRVVTFDDEDEDVFNMIMPSETYLKIRHDIRFCKKIGLLKTTTFRILSVIISLMPGYPTREFTILTLKDAIVNENFYILQSYNANDEKADVCNFGRVELASFNTQPDSANFFGDLMNEYKKIINDIDELCLKFYEMWGKYGEKVIYLDEERRLFETTQIVVRSL